jgi:hypothetical protein
MSTIAIIDGNPGSGPCTTCGQAEETRFGVCFGCANAGERHAACRSVAQHIAKAASNVRQGRWQSARYDLSWAWQRLTNSGDYKPGGYFDREHPGFR